MSIESENEWRFAKYQNTKKICCIFVALFVSLRELLRTRQRWQTVNKFFSVEKCVDFNSSKQYHQVSLLKVGNIGLFSCLLEKKTLENYIFF